MKQATHKEREQRMVERFEHIAGRYKKKIKDAAGSEDADVERGLEILKGRVESIEWTADTVRAHGAEMAVQLVRNSAIAMAANHYETRPTSRVDNANSREKARRFDMAAFTLRNMERIYWECFLAPEPEPEITITANDGPPGQHPGNSNNMAMFDDRFLATSSPPGGTLWKSIAEGVLADAVEFVTQYVPKEAPLHTHVIDHDKKHAEIHGEPVWIRAVMLVDMWMSFDQVHKEEGTSQQAPGTPATPEALEAFEKGGTVGFRVPAGEEPPEIAMSLADKLTSVWESTELPLAELFVAIDAAPLSEIDKFEEVCKRRAPCVWAEAKGVLGRPGGAKQNRLTVAMGERFGVRVWAVVMRCVAYQCAADSEGGE